MGDRGMARSQRLELPTALRNNSANWCLLSCLKQASRFQKGKPQVPLNL